MRYFTIRGYDVTIPITEEELPKAIATQIAGKDTVAIFKEGSIIGSQIFAIVPDYHKAMGFHREYKLTSEDWAVINRECRNYQGFIEDVKKLVLQAKRENKMALIAKPPAELSEGLGVALLGEPSYPVTCKQCSKDGKTKSLSRWVKEYQGLCPECRTPQLPLNS